jgi:hypothetical protein
MPLRNIPSEIRAELDQFSKNGHSQAEEALNNLDYYDPTQIVGDPHSTYHIGRRKEATVEKYLCQFTKNTIIKTRYGNKTQAVSVPEEHKRSALLLQLSALNNMLSD